MQRTSRAEQGSMARGKGRAGHCSTHAHERRMRARAHATHARGTQRKQSGAEQSGDEQTHERGEAGMELIRVVWAGSDIGVLVRTAVGSQPL